MKRLIGEQRQRRTALEPNQILHRGPGRHGLLNKFDVPVFGQPFNVAQRLFLCRPRFVGINAQRFPGRDLAKRPRLSRSSAEPVFNLRMGYADASAVF